MQLPPYHRRRIKTEEKAKIVAVVWGTELIQFIVGLAFLHQDDLKKGMNIYHILLIIPVIFILFFI